MKFLILVKIGLKNMNCENRKSAEKIRKKFGQPEYHSNCYSWKVESYKVVVVCFVLFRKLHRFGVFIVDFEHISHLFLMFLLLTLRK